MEDINDWLRLALANGVGPVSAGGLLRRFNSPKSILSSSKQELIDAGLNQNQAQSLLGGDIDARIERTLDWAGEENHHIIALSSSEYPKRLRELHDAPIVLYAIGDKEVLSTAQLAIIGSRKPTPSSARTAHEFAKSIAQRGVSITSGLALGIDAEAHRGCLQADGLTIAVAATGLDRIYPAKHRNLALEIIKKGAMVSEFPLGTTPQAAYFPRRNRIISGLSIGVLVVEAAVHSGSLTTARHAIEQGREVMAMPGSIHNPLARGCHRLIRQGAKLVETVDDILEELAGQIGEFTILETNRTECEAATENTLQDPQYAKLFSCLDFSPQGIDTLIECSGLAANEVASMLLILQLKGLIEALDGNRYMRC